MSAAPNQQWKKVVEAWALAGARKAGAPIPPGGVFGEAPDFNFRTDTGMLGIEVTELVRPASSNGGIPPLAEEAAHQRIIEQAQKDYYNAKDANPAKVVTYFAGARGRRLNVNVMARTLSDFVRANIHRANPVIGFSQGDVPEGFGPMSITSEFSDWWGGESGGYTISEIREQLAVRIKAKNELLPTYRAKLGNGAQVWLLIYSTVAVSRSMSIPHGINEWRFPFDFDRVFWFAGLEGEVVEIGRLQ
jgi:hypothetical protein